MIYKVLSHSLGPLGLQAKLLVGTITDEYTESHKYWDLCLRCDKDLFGYNIRPYINLYPSLCCFSSQNPSTSF